MSAFDAPSSKGKTPQDAAAPAAEDVFLERSAASLSRFINTLAELTRLRARLGSDADDAMLRKRIDQNMSDCRSYIHDLNALTRRHFRGTSARVQHSRLLKQFQDALQRYYGVTEDILRLERDFHVRSAAAMRPPSFTTGHGDLDDHSFGGRREAQRLLPRDLEEVEQGDVDAQLVAEVNAEMRDLQDELSALHSLMHDVSDLIEEQGEAIDEAEDAVVGSNETVVATNRNLKKSAALAGSAAFLSMVACVVLMVIAAILIGVVLIILLFLYLALRR